MQIIDSFELDTPQVAALRLHAGCTIRVTGGRLWLTVQGQSDDIWLQTGQAWTLPTSAQAKVPATLWISAEPSAAFQIAHVVSQTPRRKASRAKPELLPLGAGAAAAALRLAAGRLGLKITAF